MAATVYVETTLPSAYVSARRDAGSVYRSAVTRRWWTEQLHYYEIWTSDAAILELQRGHWPGQLEALRLVEPLRRLDIDDEVMGVAARYVAEQLVPRSLGGDAVHLAAACVHEMDFLMTWNIRHLANPNKADHLAVINRRMGLLTPRIVTPDALWKE